jgi:hypothetical protein
MTHFIRSLACLATVLVQVATGANWTQPVEVEYDQKRCIAYRAQWNGEVLLIEAAIEPGWHTFAMDNKQRQQEKLAGKPSLGLEMPTQITLSGGLTAQGPWFQSPPADFSKPEIRWFTWGFEKQAVFAVKAGRSGAEPARVGIRGQACTESICKNIDVTIEVPVAAATSKAKSSDINLQNLVQVRR